MSVRWRFHPDHCSGKHLRGGWSSALVSLSLLSGFAAFNPAEGEAECRIVFSRPPTSSAVLHDPFSLLRTSPSIDLELTNTSGSACTADLSIGEGDITSGSLIRMIEGLSVRLTALADLRPVREQTGTWRIELEAGERMPVRLEGELVVETVTPAGRHERELHVGLSSPGAPTPYEERLVLLALETPPRAQMNISGTSAGFGETRSLASVDFGEAETGKSIEVFIQTRANAPARLTFLSASGGRLLLNGNPESGHEIPYSAYVDGFPIGLSTASFRDVAASPAFAGVSHRMRLTLGNVRPSPAGRYSDQITIEISNL